MTIPRSPILSSLNLTTVASSSAPTIGTVISTEAAHAFVSSARGQIRLSAETLPEVTHSFVFPAGTIYFSPFSAQKSHVKPQNHLTLSNKRKSSWHFS
jgi:hypothetical protein